MWIKKYLNTVKTTHFLQMLLLILPWFIFFVLIPPFHIPDEYGHYAYIQSLAHGRYPKLEKVTEINCASPEGLAFEARYKHGSAYILNYAEVSPPLPAGLSDEALCSTQGQHPPLYYAVATGWYKLVSFMGVEGLLRYQLVRLTSLVFFVTFLIFAYKLLKLFFKESLVPWMMLLLGFQPLLVSLSTNINPEIAVITFSSVTIYYLTLFSLEKKLRWQHVFWLAFLVVCGFYSKVTGILLAPIAGLGILWMNRSLWSRALSQAAVFSVIVMAAIAPFFWWNYQLYGRPLENGLMYLVVRTTFPEQITATMQGAYLLKDVYLSLFQVAGDIGRLDAKPFSEVRVLYLSLVLLGFFGGTYTTFFGPRSDKKLLPSLVLFLVLIGLSFLLYIALGYEYMKLAWLGPVLQIRYLFLAIMPVTIFVFKGLFAVLNISEIKTLKLLFFLSVLHLNLIIFWLIIPRFYL